MKKQEEIVFVTRIVHGRTHVLTEPINKRDRGYPKCNYLDTDLALAGILQEGQTLEQFKESFLTK